MNVKEKTALSIVCMSFFVFINIFTAYSCVDERQYIVDIVDNIDLLDSDYDNRFNILTENELNECIQSGIVHNYEEDYIVELFDSDVSDVGTTDTALKWDYEMINAAEATRISCEGQNINIGVIDSGISYHPDLSDSIKDGYNYLTDSTDVTDNKGHGTFVSGLIAANPNGMGINGIAPKTNIIPLKCFDNGYKTRVSTICSAIYDAVDIYECDIINMSFGITSYSSTFEKAINYATDNGVVIVAAVGNKGNDTLYYPATFENVIGVGSINKEGEKSAFSQYNDSVFLVAPGEDVWSTDNEGTYSQKSGTSFSTPLVAGMIAVMMNVEDGIDNYKIKEYLKQSCVDLGDEDYDTYFGYGMIDIENTISHMLRDHKFFISPIEKDENVSYVTVLNNSPDLFQGYCMWGEYKKTYMNDMDWNYFELNPQSTVTIETNITKNKIKCFLWKSIDDVTIISNFRESVDK